MKRRILAILLLCTMLFLLSGCVSQTADPLLKNETTAVPGLAMNVTAASADQNNADVVSVTLYFRYLDEPMLAPEMRTLTVPQDESLEYAIVQALVDGPSAGHTDLRRLLPAATQVESVVSPDDILFVTLNEDFLYDDIPDGWAENENWINEAPVLRKLIVQSIVASVTENNPYTGVQMMIHKSDEVQASLRLDNSYFLNGSTGLSDPIVRDESLLLTPANTAKRILTAWQEHDYETLYLYMALEGRPSQASFAETLSLAASLDTFTVSSGSVANNGQAATITAGIKLLSSDGSKEIKAYPILLMRENGVWKLSYDRLQEMMMR